MQIRMNEKGFSLLEWIIASAFSTLIISSLIMIYLTIKTNNNRQQFLTDFQETGRFALGLLSQRIRLAGYVGCNNSNNPVDQNQAITGYSSLQVPSWLQGQVKEGTDALVINSCMTNQQISQNTALTTMAYYIGDTNRTNKQGQPILGLFQKAIDGNRDELASGVEQMQILYGVTDYSGAPLTYYSAAQVNDWQKVRGLQIELLINSIDAALTHPESYYFHGETISPKDLLIHKEWSTYIFLRERK